MFRDLIPLLAERFHIVAPDLPGFGRRIFKRDQLRQDRGHHRPLHRKGRIGPIRIYIFIYGAPTGLRLALKYPVRITAIITQNGNAYEEGLSEGWNPIRAYWKEHSQANRDALRAFLSPGQRIGNIPMA